jgi:hypothetical protein
MKKAPDKEAFVKLAVDPYGQQPHLLTFPSIPDIYVLSFGKPLPITL